MSKDEDPIKHKRKFQTKRWIGCPIEDQYLNDDRKTLKQERKLASAMDRSKYKKTDREKLQAQKSDKFSQISREGLLSGKVLAIDPEGTTVSGENGPISCILRGTLKREKGAFKNIVVVGDNVLYELTDNNRGAILHVEPRRTVLSRADNLSRRKEQLIAANIDQVIITGSVLLPTLKAPLLDRYVIAAKRGGLEPLIVINKVDLLEGDFPDKVMQASEKELFEHLMKAYQDANIPIIAVSAVTGEGLDELRAVMKGKSSVFSGQSGVGKSSLINWITGLDLRVGAMVDRTGKGTHTTTSASLVPLESGGWCIDTPGIKSFGVWDLKKEDIQGYFTEISRIGQRCYYPDCSHFHEENCAVRNAVEAGEISLIRYYSYQSLIISTSEKHQRR
ncbi:MAG: ribosome small subunit-dependent GTPase A [Parachlamydiaceae bacterium]|nr:ribosome small subunit-dependent GTPase A [Parachlamydiaceae bacterium]